jgi:hypothetical protein
MATGPTSVPAGVRATIALLARIHADLDSSAQSRTAVGATSTEHAAPSLGSPAGAQKAPRRAVKTEAA